MLRKQALNNAAFTVPKNRKPKFDLTLHIIDLNNIPLVCGNAYVKWHLPSSSAAEHRGKTGKAFIRDHRATWDYTKELSVRLTIDKTQALQECDIHFEIVQEYFEGGRGGRVHLGNVKLNLAEYTQPADIPGRDPRDKEDGEDGMITRRYLMQDSKVNATLKAGIRMRQTEGDTNFIPPPLKSAMVIGGIAGIMNAEAGETDDMPSITSKTRELSEAQDTYRRTLAATWACQSGDLPPDRLIEDLFAGGDGGRMEPPQPTKGLQNAARVSMSRPSIDSNVSSDNESRATITPSFLSPESARTPHKNGSKHHGHGSNHHHHHHHSSDSSVNGRGSIEHQIRHGHDGKRSGHHQQDPHEVTEFDLRDDLKSWQVKVR